MRLKIKGIYPDLVAVNADDEEEKIENLESVELFLSPESSFLTVTVWNPELDLDTANLTMNNEILIKYHATEKDPV